MSSASSPVSAAASSQHSAASYSSTEEREQSDKAYYEEIRHGITELVAVSFHCANTSVNTKHIKGGASNRVVGFDIYPEKSKRSCLDWVQKLLRRLLRKPAPAAQSYVVRIPRRNHDDMSLQIAKLKVVHLRLPFATPDVLHYDVSENNILKMPYMIQKRIPGIQVRRVIDSWNLEQQLSLLHGVIEIMNHIATVEANAGDISVENLTSSPSQPIRIDKIQTSSLEGDVGSCVIQTPLDHLLEIIESHRQIEIKDGFCYRDLWDGLSAISKALKARGYLDGPTILVHGDFQSYNLLAEVTSSSPVIKITGVIDWDDAYFAPKVMALRPPFWLWMDDDDWTTEDDGTERKANIEPVNENDRILRQTFLANVSDEYKRLAFDPEAVLARRLYHLLRYGLSGDWELLEAQHVIRDWDELHPEDHVKFGDGYFNEDYSWIEGASENCFPPFS